VSKTNAGVTSKGWRVAADNGSVFNILLGQASGTAFIAQSPAPQPTNTWLHVGVTVTPAAPVRIYVGGAPVAMSATNPMPLVEDTAAIMRIGCRPGSNFFAGKVDDLRVYNRALDDGEMAALVK
jgi:hypothetical protein